MRKTMVVVVMALCLSIPAMAHTPVPTMQDCALMGGGTQPYVPLPDIDIDPLTGLMVLGGVVDFTAADGNYDFCAYADTVYCSLGPLAGLGLDEVNDFGFLIQCINMDINGPLDLEADIPVSGNGIPDAQYELGILAQVLNDPDDPLHVAANESFKGYYQNIRDLVVEALSVATFKDTGNKDLRGTVNLIAPHLVGGLTGLLAAHATMGDDMTNAALDELLNLLADIGLEPPEGGIASLGIPLPAVGPDGDASGNGLTNREMFYCFEASGPAAFVNAALDAAVGPAAVDGPADAEIETNIALVVEMLCGAPISYQWYKDGILLEDETGSALDILNAQVADSGLYSVDVTLELSPPEKAPVVVLYTAEFYLEVTEEPDVPVSGALGLMLLAGATALAGVAGLRRRK